MRGSNFANIVIYIRHDAFRRFLYSSVLPDNLPVTFLRFIFKVYFHTQSPYNMVCTVYAGCPGDITASSVLQWFRKEIWAVWQRIFSFSLLNPQHFIFSATANTPNTKINKGQRQKQPPYLCRKDKCKYDYYARTYCGTAPSVVTPEHKNHLSHMYSTQHMQKAVIVWL